MNARASRGRERERESERKRCDGDRASICRNRALLRNKITQRRRYFISSSWGCASRVGFIGLLTDSSGECIRGENVNSPADSAARVYTTNTDARARRAHAHAHAWARTASEASTIRLTTVEREAGRS